MKFKILVTLQVYRKFSKCYKLNISNDVVVINWLSTTTSFEIYYLVDTSHNYEQ